MDSVGLLLCSSFAYGLTLFLDTSALTATGTLEEQLGATNAANLVQIERLDIGRKEGEGPLNTHAIGDLPNGEGSCLASTLTLDHITLETLDTFLVSFDDFIVNGDVITGFELRKFSFSCQLFVHKGYSSLHKKTFKGWQR
jgi:hypothetical protein